MKKFSDKLSQMLTAFVVAELGSKALDGINYTLKLKNKDNDDIMTYNKIREEADKCGYDHDEVFIVHEYVNGYSFELEPKITNKISSDLAMASCKITGKHKDLVDFVMNKAEQKKEYNEKLLANRVIKASKSGDTELKVVIYSSNTSGLARVITTNESGNNSAVTLKTHCLNLSSIEEINRKYLMTKGLRIAKLSNMYILNTKTSGVVVDLTIEEV